MTEEHLKELQDFGKMYAQHKEEVLQAHKAYYEHRIAQLEEELKKYQTEPGYTGWNEVGVVGVDAGLLWLGDPCYCVTPDANEHPAKTWSEFCDKLPENVLHKQWNYKLGHPGLGVSVSTGYGDGCYSVYIKYGDEGRISEVKVVFMDNSEDTDEETEE